MHACLPRVGPGHRRRVDAESWRQRSDDARRASSLTSRCLDRAVRSLERTPMPSRRVRRRVWSRRLRRTPPTLSARVGDGFDVDSVRGARDDRACPHSACWSGHDRRTAKRVLRQAHPAVNLVFATLLVIGVDSSRIVGVIGAGPGSVVRRKWYRPVQRQGVGRSYRPRLRQRSEPRTSVVAATSAAPQAARVACEDNASNGPATKTTCCGRACPVCSNVDRTKPAGNPIVVTGAKDDGAAVATSPLADQRTTPRAGPEVENGGAPLSSAAPGVAAPPRPPLGAIMPGHTASDRA